MTAWPLVVLALAAPPPPATRPPPPPMLQAFKRLERALLLESDHSDERGAIDGPSRASGAARSIPVRPWSPAIPLPAPRAALLVPTNHLMNNIASDLAPGSTQSEVTIAALGSHILAAWNDGEGGSGLGFGWSMDGGATWADGGVPPLAGGVVRWLSDPVLAVNERSGEFFLVALAIAAGPSNAIGMVRGSFVDDAFAWGTPSVVRVVRDTLPDKPWIAADSLTGNLYVSYTTFFSVGETRSDAIEFQRSTDGGRSWSPATKVNPVAEDGTVQGSRPAVGPDGELHVVWKSIDTTAAARGRDFQRLRTSRDQGRSFGTAVSVAGVFTNFGSGSPGFDRGFGLGFPSIAVDRSPGPRRGRIYVAWNESLDFYDDSLGTLGTVLEQEPNSGPLTATPVPPGASVRGSSDGQGDVDHFRLHGEQSQTLVVYLDSLASGLRLSLSLMCRDGETRLAYSSSYSGPNDLRHRLFVFTLPENGDYFLRMEPQGDSTGPYRIATGFAERRDERGRDHRDAFVAHSDDGVTWSTPVRVTDDPPWFDDWLSEVAVSADGRAYTLWYDWRDGPPGACGSLSNVFLARSDDGGEAWEPLGSVTELQTPWSAVPSNLAPNQGDYLGLWANDTAVYSAWADGRFGTPDAFMAAWPLAVTGAEVALVSARAEPDRVALLWQATGGSEIVAEIQRREPDTDWRARGTLVADGAGRLAWVDRAVAPGRRYGYRLSVRTASGETLTGETWVDVPKEVLRLAIDPVRPNPSDRPIAVRFTVPVTGPATVELIDVLGRRVASRTLEAVAGSAQVVELGGSDLVAGLYLVRLSQLGRAVTGRAVILK